MMSIGVRDRKLLWTKAGNRCSFRYNGYVCDKELIISGDNNVIIGKECHIVDTNQHTSRFKDIPNKDSYDNLILMCGEHHDMIDSDGDKFTTKILKEMKESHESSIADRLEMKEIEPLIIRDSFFKTEAKNVDEAIGMEVNRPAQLQNVKSELKVEYAKKAVGFSTNQGLTSIITFCSDCHKPVPFAFTGKPPAYANCSYCGAEIKL